MITKQDIVKLAAEKLIALRALTRTTGTRTTRAQNRILQSLPLDMLTDVAIEVRRVEAVEAVLSGRTVEGVGATADAR